MSEATGYGLLIPFLNDGEDFCHGWECGIISSEMSKGRTFEKYTMHTANIKQAEVIAKHYHYTLSFENIGDGWSLMSGYRQSAN